MAPCKAGAKGQEFTMDAEGVITSAASPSLALGATGASLNHFVLTAKSGASLKFRVTPNGNLGVKGGCAQAGACGSGNMTCLDSHCGTYVVVWKRHTLPCFFIFNHHLLSEQSNGFAL